MSAQPVPDGFHTVTPHLTLRGARKAIGFYEQALGANLLACHEMPGSDTVMHALIAIGDSVLMLNDEFPQSGAVSPQALDGSPVTIHLYVEDVDTAFERAVSSGMEVLFPVEDTFWGDRYGLLRDPYGHRWSIATHKEDVSEAEMAQRAMQAFAGKDQNA